MRSQPFDRNDPCQVCQTTDQLVLKDITIEKRVELLPYIAGSLSGVRPNRNASLNYDKFKPNAGLGLNIDLNKNSTLEVTLNPDFSQVEADVTQIDVNSSYALEYPERRPFFNRGTDIVNFTDGAFYSRSINNPLISTKLLSQAKKIKNLFSYRFRSKFSLSDCRGRSFLLWSRWAILCQCISISAPSQ